MFHSQFDLSSAGEGRVSWQTALRLAAEKGGRAWIAEDGEVVAQLTLTSALAEDAAAGPGRFRCARCGAQMALDDLDIRVFDNEVAVPLCRDAAACSQRAAYGDGGPPLPSRLRCPGCGRRSDKAYRDGRRCTCPPAAVLGAGFPAQFHRAVAAARGQVVLVVVHAVLKPPAARAGEHQQPVHGQQLSLNRSGGNLSSPVLASAAGIPYAIA